MKKRLIRISLVLIVLLVASSLIVLRMKGINSKKGLIERVLRLATDYEYMSGFGGESEKNIILSSENIEPDLIPKLEGMMLEYDGMKKLVILSPSKIKEKAYHGEVFSYLKFRKMDIGVFKATLQLDMIAAERYNSSYVFMEGIKVPFHRYLVTWFQSKWIVLSKS